VGVARDKAWSGVGFMFQKDYVGIDLDHCVEYGKLNDFAQNVLSKCTSYTELSPSRTGIHIIARGDIPKSLKTKEIEIYNTGRYFTVTGDVLHGRRTIHPVDVSSYFPSGMNEASSISEKLGGMQPGNVDITLTSLAGKLFKRGLQYQDVFSLLKEKANKAGHDDTALNRICRSVERYHPKGESSYGSISMGAEEEEHKPIEIFTPSTHGAEFLKRIEETNAGSTELFTGFPTLDSHTGGLKKGGILVVGARTGIGKTSFSFTVANNLLKRGKRVLIFSTEMDWFDAFGRFASIRTGISLHSISNARGELTTPDKQKLGAYSKQFESQPLYIVEEPEPSLRVVSEEISRVRPDVFIFDHIQRIANVRDQRYLELAKFIKGLNTLCRENNCAGIVNSQLNRIAEREVPALSHLKECGALEEEAHAVILLSSISQGMDSDSLVRADLAKNRGPKGRVELRLNGVTAEFTEENYEGITSDSDSPVSQADE
jgi:KaiC/GvpD/RAD55 family RecA-like ATPase